jgi:hypothetical protein
MTKKPTGKSRRTEARKVFLHGVFTTALEGGIGYWSAASAYHWMKSDPRDEDGYSPADLDGFYATIQPAADDDTWGVFDTDDSREMRIDMAVIARGVGMFKDYAMGKIDGKGQPSTERKAVPLDHYWRQFLAADRTNGADGDYDSEVADIIVQFGLFGQHVYG